MTQPDTPPATPSLILSHDRVALFHGDSALLDLPPDSVDAIVCDPPAAISFMGRGWDDDRGGYDGWTRWLAAVLAPSVRALRPGGAALLWALPRTSHWTARAVELAGLEIRDVHHDIISADEILQDFVATLDERQRAALARVIECAGAPIVYQLFGSGFPKSLDISKAIDAALGAERRVTGTYESQLPGSGTAFAQDAWSQAAREGRAERRDDPATAAAAAWKGYGSALKPSVEHWILARKPLSGTYADNVLAHGTGALNIDACRIGTTGETFHAPQSDPANRVGHDAVQPGAGGDAEKMQAAQRASIERTATLGRWPAHLSLRHAPGCELIGIATDLVQTFENVGAAHGAEEHRDGGESTNFAMGRQVAGAPTTVARDVYRCAPGCPVAELDAQSGMTKSSPNVRRTKARENISKGAEKDRETTGHADTGGASRFFLTVPPFRYVAKPSRREKDAGLGHLKSTSGGEATDREDGSAGLSSPRAGAGRTGGARNSHETVKSISLMEWLIKLVVPSPETLGRPGVILDPFAGSGTTGVAALALGHDWIGCEQGGEKNRYIPIVLGRIRHALGLPAEDPEGE